MATISSEKLSQDVKAIIKTADLSTLSAKKIRLQLQEKYDTDLTDRKKELEKIIQKAFEERQNAEEESSEDEAANDKAKNGDSQSDSESDFEEPEDSAEPVQKKAKKSAPKSTASVDDEELAKQLQEQEDSGRGGRRTRNQSKPVRRKPAKPKAKTGEGGEKKKTGYSKPCALSEQLAGIVGANELARSDVIKKMWEIVRERDLLDPKNKQFMICDDELYKLFGRRRVRTFGMMKYLANHIFKI